MIDVGWVTRVAGRVGLLVVLVAAATGCMPSRMAVRPLSYDVDVRVDPTQHTLSGTTTVEVEPLEVDEHRGRIELLLHPDLTVAFAATEGATLVSRSTRPGRRTVDAVVPARHRLVVEDPGESVRIRIDYAGTLFQDVEAGEESGKIHNFSVSAHVSDAGLYLDEDGYWYPRPATPGDLAPDRQLADYRLRVEPVEGFEFVAGLESEAPGADGRLRWSSPFPLQGMVLLGGPLERFSRRHGDVELHTVLAPGKEAVAEDILAAAAEYLDRYEPLIGPYPFKEFTLLEAFFSSGFAFPTCTQIVGSQLTEYKQYRRHGYLDHELLHNWWGNGIFVDPRDGNWCEALASYMGNYYGHVLDGDPVAARKQRRNHSNLLSAIDAERDKPLGTFGMEDGASRGIGYQKGAAVFHMLERKIGAEALFAGLRRLTAERMGAHASWDDLREAFERESGADLGGFFDQWVRRGGAPSLELTGVDWSPGSERAAVTISQGPTDFRLEVPLRLFYGDRPVDVVVGLDAPVDTVEVATEPTGLTAIELDPDYHVFRKLKPEEAMPTSNLTARAERLLVVVPEGELADGYRILIEDYHRSVLGDPDDPIAGHDVEVLTAAAVRAEDLAARDVLIVGDAVRHPTVRAFIERTRCPVTWTETGFVVDGQTHAEPGRAVYLTVHHPDRPESGVTIYHGNSPAALANARVLAFYPNSLLVFDSPPDAAPGSDPPTSMPRTEVLHRMDFEFHERIEL